MYTRTSSDGTKYISKPRFRLLHRLSWFGGNEIGTTPFMPLHKTYVGECATKRTSRYHSELRIVQTHR